MEHHLHRCSLVTSFFCSHTELTPPTRAGFSPGGWMDGSRFCSDEGRFCSGASISAPSNKTSKHAFPTSRQCFPRGWSEKLSRAALGSQSGPASHSSRIFNSPANTVVKQCSLSSKNNFMPCISSTHSLAFSF